MKNQVQLITYVDRLGGDLRGTRELLEGPLSGLFGGVHLLPFFYPIDGADAGFDPIDHTRVDPKLGAWKDLRALADRVDVMADVIVNHISSRSDQFRNFVERGARSSYAGMFLTLDRVFPKGASESDLLAIYRPRPGLPFTPMTLDDGSRRLLWTTFTPQQIDIDVEDSRSIEYLDGILEVLAANGVRMIRLDAVGYAVKRAGSNCFMTAATFEFIADFAERANRLGLEVLVEVHSYFRRQMEIANRVDWVYDFALPPLVLHTIFGGDTSALKRWIGIRPVNTVTVLDTHDGIGIIDIGADAEDRDASPGLVRQADLDRLVEQIASNSHGESARATGAAASNLDLYQVNCTFFDALGRDDLKYLLARAIQFFVPGIPQIYYVGLLAGGNDLSLLAETGVGRDINRHYYEPEEIERALERPVVSRLLALIRLRNSHPAFAGRFRLGESPDHALELSWENDSHFARLQIDLRGFDYRLEFSTASGMESLPLADRYRREIS